jgi:hypothetical protein
MDIEEGFSPIERAATMQRQCPLKQAFSDNYGPFFLKLFLSDGDFCHQGRDTEIAQHI